MKTWMKARILWIPFEKGGRHKKLPARTRYCPLIVFPKAKTEGAWSAEIITNSIEDNNESIVEISFLSLDAPFELLKPGAEFELYEGQKLVATGVMLQKIN